MEFLLAIIFMIDFTSAIECNFSFIEYDPNYPKDFEFILNTKPEANFQFFNREPFECDEPKAISIATQSRFNVLHSVLPSVSNGEDNDDFESVNACETIKRNIYPKALNNVRNQMTPVVNTNEIVQTINTEECLYRGQLCSDSSVKLTFICVQKYVKISLQAFNDKREVYNDFFYFPSYCACEVRKVKEQRY